MMIVSTDHSCFPLFRSLYTSARLNDPFSIAQSEDVSSEDDSIVDLRCLPSDATSVDIVASIDRRWEDSLNDENEIRLEKNGRLFCTRFLDPMLSQSISGYVRASRKQEELSLVRVRSSDEYLLRCPVSGVDERYDVKSSVVLRAIIATYIFPPRQPHLCAFLPGALLPPPRKCFDSFSFQ